MNKESSPLALQLNEAAILENLLPTKSGILKLDRSRTTLKYVSGLAVTNSEGLGCYSWKDTAGNLVVIFLFLDTSVKVRIIYDTNRLDTAPAWTDLLALSYVISANNAYHSKNSFIQYNGIVRMGGGQQSFSTVLTNFTTVSGGYTTYRNRFSSWSTYLLGGLLTSTGIRMHTVYMPEVERCNAAALDTDGATSPTWTAHQIGIYAAEAGSGSDSMYEVGDEIRYGITLEYDFNQESPMAVSGLESQPHVTITTAGRPVNLRIFVPGGTDVRWPNGGATSGVAFDERVTGINIYRSINSGEWYHLYRVDIENGVYDDNGVQVRWQNSGNGGLVNTCIALQESAGGDTYVIDQGYLRYNSYRARTGFDNYNVYQLVTAGNDTLAQNAINTTVTWSVGCMFRDRAIVNGLVAYQEGQLRYALHKRLYVSKPSEPDVFPPYNYIQLGETEQSDFVAICPLSGDRFVAWDSNWCYIVNGSANDPTMWFLEKTHNLGLATGNAVAEIPDRGLAFANDKGLYLIDLYGNITEASSNIRTDWRQYNDLLYGVLYYDRNTDLLFVATTGRADKLGYQLDFEKQSLYHWSDDKNNYGATIGTGVVHQLSGFFEGFEGEIECCQFNTSGGYINFFNIEEVVGNELDITYRGPELTMGNYGALKRGVHLWIVYKLFTASTQGMVIYRNDGTSYDVLGNIPQATILTRLEFDCPYNFYGLQPAIFVADSNNYFELHEIGLEFKTIRAR